MPSTIGAVGSEETLRVVAWNCHRARAASAAWEYLLELEPDVALLQEVSGIPESVRGRFDHELVPASGRLGTPQTFGTALLVRGRIGAPIRLHGLSEWTDTELDRSAGNLVCREIVPVVGPPLMAIAVHNPAWAIPAERLVDVDVSGVRLTLNAEVWAADVMWASLRALGLGDREWIVAGDFNLSESFDERRGPRGNREYLVRRRAMVPSRR